jgi:hypothetical protein
MQLCNHLPGQVVVTENFALGLNSELRWLKHECRNDRFGQISGTIPFPFQVFRKMKHLD